MNHIDIQYVYLSLPLLLLIIIYYFIVKSQFNSILFIYRAQFIHNATLKCFTLHYIKTARNKKKERRPLWTLASAEEQLPRKGLNRVKKS